MKFRTIVLFLLVVLILIFISAAIYMNHDLLKTSFHLPAGLEVDLDRILILVFFAGTLGAFLMYRSIRLDSNLTWRTSRHFVRALNHLYADRYPEALEEIEKAGKKSANNYDILMTMGVIYKRLERYEDAAAAFRKAFARKTTVQAFLKLLDVLPDSDSKPDGRELLKLAQKIRKESRITAYRALLDYLKKSEDWVRAVKVYWKGRKEDQKQFPESEGAEIRYELGKTRESEHILKELIEDFPDFTPAYVRYGELLRQKGKIKEMLAVMKQGFSRTHIVVFLQMIEDALLEQEDPEAAVEVLGQIVLNENHHVLARFYLGKLYYRLEMLEKAREIFEQLEGEVVYIPALTYYLARIYHRKGEYHTAIHYLEQMVRHAQLLDFHFHCSRCNTPLDKWTERCPQCGSINSVRMIFEELKPDSNPIFML
ncbi:MAG: tetratricopeptide repeat protein [Acidobacteria bacterium]|nr:tetratricopeptide repeat protein [Acidobacteriota bacterium]